MLCTSTHRLWQSTFSSASFVCPVVVLLRSLLPNRRWGFTSGRWLRPSYPLVYAERRAEVAVLYAKLTRKNNFAVLCGACGNGLAFMAIEPIDHYAVSLSRKPPEPITERGS